MLLWRRDKSLFSTKWTGLLFLTLFWKVQRKKELLRVLCRPSCGDSSAAVTNVELKLQSSVLYVLNELHRFGDQHGLICCSCLAHFEHFHCIFHFSRLVFFYTFAETVNLFLQEVKIGIKKGFY